MAGFVRAAKHAEKEIAAIVTAIGDVFAEERFGFNKLVGLDVEVDKDPNSFLGVLRYDHSALITINFVE